MKLAIVVLGVVLIFEGVPWFLTPGGVRRLLVRMADMSDTALRVLSLAMMLIGLALVYAGTH
jgi:uncharacterized protein YjeT (DUF2065 family)